MGHDFSNIEKLRLVSRGACLSDSTKRMMKRAGWYDTFSDVGHAALDTAGLIPVVGNLADVANSAWYLGEGITNPDLRASSFSNAGLSAAQAIPGFGYLPAVAKYLNKGRKALNAARKMPVSGLNKAKHVVDKGKNEVGKLTNYIRNNKADLAKQFGGELAMDAAISSAMTYPTETGMNPFNNWVSDYNTIFNMTPEEHQHMRYADESGYRAFVNWANQKLRGNPFYTKEEVLEPLAKSKLFQKAQKNNQALFTVSQHQQAPELETEKEGIEIDPGLYPGLASVLAAAGLLVL
jgi:hypothetical protein